MPRRVQPLRGAGELRLGDCERVQVLTRHGPPTMWNFRASPPFEDAAGYALRTFSRWYLRGRILGVFPRVFHRFELFRRARPRARRAIAGNAALDLIEIIEVGVKAREHSSLPCAIAPCPGTNVWIAPRLGSASACRATRDRPCGRRSSAGISMSDSMSAAIRMRCSGRCRFSLLAQWPGAPRRPRATVRLAEVEPADEVRGRNVSIFDSARRRSPRRHAPRSRAEWASRGVTALWNASCAIVSAFGHHVRPSTWSQCGCVNTIVIAGCRDQRARCRRSRTAGCRGPPAPCASSSSNTTLFMA